jgi:lysophospholipase L1-like esterase
MNARTLVLLGDSILDNAPYTTPERDTTAHLQNLLPAWTVVRLAQDGATMSDMRSQLRELPNRPLTAVLSIGGNDAIEHISVLDTRASNSADVLEELLAIADNFGSRYEAVARSVAEHADRLVLCTIYEVQLQPARYAQLARVPLALLNDRIIRTASRLGLEVLELRSVCTETSDFVLQIEPSAQGAAKIARAITAIMADSVRLKSARVFSA